MCIYWDEKKNLCIHPQAPQAGKCDWPDPDEEECPYYENEKYEVNEEVKYKWIVMQELEESNTATPYKIVATEERAEELCLQAEKENPGFIFWTYLCEEE